jgi:type I restriction enzyme S subunit
MSTNQQINSIICNNCDSNFIYYQLVQNKHLIKNRANQSAVPIINKTDFGKFKIIKPQNMLEQQKIATILSNIDSKITSQEKYKEKLERLKKSLMQKLLTGDVRVKV